ncbi:flagellin [Hathewaya histolytica]|uniref:Flagellin n=1 Tax=Hathewaya histolytica TaxID=1498 RepID=A0A4U9RBM3_HATHI|nr:flagellin [Hathewaya histolytica]VTQ87643.1 flagellin/flagellar hook associated protein [Hathewaya histolytica]
MRLSQNLASLNVYRNHLYNLKNQSRSMARISSGSKFDSFKDDPIAYAQSEKFRLQLGSYTSAAKNIQDNISMLQTAEGGMNSISDSLNRIRTLVVSSGGGSTEKDKAHIMNEIESILEGIDYTSKNTEFNSIKLLCNEESTDIKNPQIIKSLIGNGKEDKVDIPIYNITTESLGLKEKDKVNIYFDDIPKTLMLIDNSIGAINSIRSKYGALESRLEENFNNMNEIYNTVQKAESFIRDTDIGEEIIEVTKSSILIEAGNAIMVQTNKFPLEVLRILENAK